MEHCNFDTEQVIEIILMMFIVAIIEEIVRSESNNRKLFVTTFIHNPIIYLAVGRRIT